MWTTACLLLLTLCGGHQDDAISRLNKDQRLIVAAFELDVEQVRASLADGANPMRLGIYDRQLFEDKWNLGYSPIGSNKWTPLLAVANSNRAPQPEAPAENTVEGLELARKKLMSIDPKLIQMRDRKRVEIAELLIAAKADLNLDDGYGGTALSASIYDKFEDLSLLLITAGADINTKTRIYIDGTDNITPMHRATSQPVVLEAMIKHGAKVEVKDSTGETPLHWATRHKNVRAVKLLLAAGADPTATDAKDRTPAYWCETYKDFPMSGDAEKKAILKLLAEAQAKK